MPVPNYSVLKGDPQPGVVSGSNPHFRIPVNTDSGMFTIDVNVQSTDGSEVLYVIDQSFTPAAPDALLALGTGVTALDSKPGGLALDFVREKIGGAPMVAKAGMSLLPAGENTMQDQIAVVVNRAIQDAQGVVYAFGSAYADANGQQGIHNIHMNQGNPPGRFEKDNGVWQDGALFLQLPSTNQWIGVFVAFQTESWTTDGKGNPMTAAANASSLA